jgi:hypothetical protein
MQAHSTSVELHPRASLTDAVASIADQAARLPADVMVGFCLLALGLALAVLFLTGAVHPGTP